MSATKPYPGIPAGILDEDLEEHMSEQDRKLAPDELFRRLFLGCADCPVKIGSLDCALGCCGKQNFNPRSYLAAWNRRAK
jgi:hypothetical protein